MLLKISCIAKHKNLESQVQNTRPSVAKDGKSGPAGQFEHPASNGLTETKASEWGRGHSTIYATVPAYSALWASS